MSSRTVRTTRVSSHNMSNRYDQFQREYQVRRATSTNNLISTMFHSPSLSRSRSLVRSASAPRRVYTIKRSSSVPSVPYSLSNDYFMNPKYRSRYYRVGVSNNYALSDEFWYDRRTYLTPIYEPTYRWTGRRYNVIDAPYPIWYSSLPYSYNPRYLSSDPSYNWSYRYPYTSYSRPSNLAWSSFRYPRADPSYYENYFDYNLSHRRANAYSPYYYSSYSPYYDYY